MEPCLFIFLPQRESKLNEGRYLFHLVYFYIPNTSFYVFTE